MFIRAKIFGYCLVLLTTCIIVIFIYTNPIAKELRSSVKNPPTKVNYWKLPTPFIKSTGVKKDIFTYLSQQPLHHRIESPSTRIEIQWANSEGYLYEYLDQMRLWIEIINKDPQNLIPTMQLLHTPQGVYDFNQRTLLAGRTSLTTFQNKNSYFTKSPSQDCMISSGIATSISLSMDATKTLLVVYGLTLKTHNLKTPE